MRKVSVCLTVGLWNNAANSCYIYKLHTTWNWIFCSNWSECYGLKQLATPAGEHARYVMSWASWRFETLAISIFVEKFVPANIKGGNKAPNYWPLTIVRHIPLKEPVLGKAFQCSDIMNELIRPWPGIVSITQFHLALITTRWIAVPTDISSVVPKLDPTFLFNGKVACAGL